MATALIKVASAVRLAFIDDENGDNTVFARFDHLLGLSIPLKRRGSADDKTTCDRAYLVGLSVVNTSGTRNAGLKLAIHVGKRN